MKLKNPGNLIAAFLILAATMSGCTHQLQIKNLNAYYNTTIPSPEKQIRIGLCTTSPGYDDQQLARSIGANLGKYNTRVTVGSDKTADVTATLSIVSDYKGSGWNFLINFPGFLVWAPAWHGYDYQISRNVSVLLTDNKTGKTITTINVPIVLDIRHANIDRTWTEISWLEVGIIAFVGGIVFIGYDDDVTPLVDQKAGHILGDYIAQKIAAGLASYQPSERETVVPAASPADSLESKLQTLKDLKEKGLITEEDYAVKKEALINSLK